MALKPGPLRDALVLIAVFAVLLGGLFLYTGTWPPAVIVESSSMMHADTEVHYGRLGTIDPGDLVLVKKIGSALDVETLVEGGATHYGKSGDVLIYMPNDLHVTPIIHRAVGFVDVRGSGADVQYFLRWPAGKPCEGGGVLQAATAQDEAAGLDRASGAWCVYGSNGVYVPSVPIAKVGSTTQNPLPYKPEHTGFLTKGDNPVTNRWIDQVSGLSATVDVTWVEGKGRGELPWLGLIKLSLAGHYNEPNCGPFSSSRQAQFMFFYTADSSTCPGWLGIGYALAPKDLWTCLGIALFVLVGLPLIYDAYKAFQVRRGHGNRPPEAPRDVDARGSGADAVTLQWTPVAGAASYRVYRGPDIIGTTHETSFTESGLDPALSYVYAVAALDGAGAEGAKSRTVSASPVAAEGPRT